MLLCQLYHLDEDELRDLLQACERFGLKLSIHGDGWYRFGTIAIELSRAEAEEERRA